MKKILSVGLLSLMGYAFSSHASPAQPRVSITEIQGKDCYIKIYNSQLGYLNNTTMSFGDNSPSYKFQEFNPRTFWQKSQEGFINVTSSTRIGDENSITNLHQTYSITGKATFPGTPTRGLYGEIISNHDKVIYLTTEVEIQSDTNLGKATIKIADTQSEFINCEGTLNFRN